VLALHTTISTAKLFPCNAKLLPLPCSHAPLLVGSRALLSFARLNPYKMCPCEKRAEIKPSQEGVKLISRGFHGVSPLPLFHKSSHNQAAWSSYPQKWTFLRITYQNMRDSDDLNEQYKALELKSLLKARGGWTDPRSKYKFFSSPTPKVSSSSFFSATSLLNPHLHHHVMALHFY
jgi:hypothetical protein